MVVIDGVTYIRPAEVAEHLGSDITPRMVYDWCRPGGRVVPIRDERGRAKLCALDDLRVAERVTRGRGRRRRGTLPAEAGSNTPRSEVA